MHTSFSAGSVMIKKPLGLNKFVIWVSQLTLSVKSCDSKISFKENPITIISNYDDSTDEHRNSCELYIGGKDGNRIYFGKPTIYENDESKYMYPNDARLRNISYSMTVHYDVEVVFKKKMKPNETIPIVNLHVHSKNLRKFYFE